MPATVMAASFEHVQKTLDIRIHVSVRIFQRITHAGLGCEMNHGGKTILVEQRFRRVAVGEIGLHEGEIGLALQDIKPRLASAPDRNSH